MLDPLHAVKVDVVFFNDAAQNVPEGNEQPGDLSTLDIHNILEENLAVTNVQKRSVDESVVQVEKRF